MKDTAAELQEETITLLIASAASFAILNILFIAGQVWEAFATLALGLYYAPLFYGIIKEKRRMFEVSMILHAISTFVIFGVGIFFFTEIFTNKSLVLNWLARTYEKNGDLAKVKKDARAVSIAMACDCFFTGAIHLLTLVYCYLTYRSNRTVRLDSFTPIGTIAVNPEIEYPDYPQMMTIPRLRTTGDGQITHEETRRPRIGSLFEPYRYRTDTADRF